MKVLKKHTCSIKDYPTEIKVSESKRAQYWKLGDTGLPKKVNITKTNTEGFYVDGNGERYLKNTKTAGKPRMLTINAQKIYVGIHHSVRSKIVNELHSLFHQEFTKQLPKIIDTKGKKILIGLHFHDIYTTKLPDLDNLGNLFVKCGIDCLTKSNNPNQSKIGGFTHKLGIIEDDKIFFISHIFTEFTHVDKIEDRKLDFIIYEVSTDFTIENILDTQLNIL